jgi:hypothetical protein
MIKRQARNVFVFVLKM